MQFGKTVCVGAEVTSRGRLFQRWLPSTGNARGPTVDSHVCRITSCEDDDLVNAVWSDIDVLNYILRYS